MSLFSLNDQVIVFQSHLRDRAIRTCKVLLDGVVSKNIGLSCRQLIVINGLLQR